MLKKAIYFSLGLGILAFLGAGSVEDEVDYSSYDYSSPSFQVRHKELADEFENNSIAAEAKYEGKLIYVRGPVGSVDKDILDNPYVAVRGEWDFVSIQCFLTDGEVSSAPLCERDKKRGCWFCW